MPGRTITSTPRKPSDHRGPAARAHVLAAATSTAAMVTNIGVEYDSDTACASGRWPIAQKPASIDTMPIAQRMK